MARKPEPELMDLPEEAEAYARADFGDVNASFVGRLIELAGEMPYARIADLGTGPGDIPIRLSRLRPAWQIAAVDGAPAMLVHAARAVRQANLERAVRLVLADAKRLPFKDGAFDIVCSNSLLHHLSDPGSMWSEIRRIIRPGGLVFVRDLARPASPEMARQIVQTHAGRESALLQEEFYRSLLAAYTVEEVRGQLAEARLDAESVAQVTDRHLDVLTCREPTPGRTGRPVG